LTNATSAIRELFALDIGAFNAAIASSPIGAQGVLMLPFLNGERVPALPHATGSILGLDSTNLNQANLCRAVVEGTTFGLRYGLDLLRESGIKSANIRLIGGGAKSAIWRQIVADIMDTPVICTTGTEAAALGAAIQAAWCHSHVEGAAESLQALSERCVSLDPGSETRPVAEHVAAYHKVYQHYRNQLQGI
jgi:xylulokinase